MSLLSAIHAAGSDDHGFFGGTWTGGYCIQQDPEEFAELVEVLRDVTGPYLGIGIAAGGVERFLSEHTGLGPIHVMDDGRHPKHGVWAENRKGIVGLREFIGDSHSEAAREWLDGLGVRFRVVGIDGDHSLRGVFQDFDLVLPHVERGGLIWFHDIHAFEFGQTGARCLWAHLKTKYEVVLETQGKYGIGVIRA